MSTTQDWPDSGPNANKQGGASRRPADLVRLPIIGSAEDMTGATVQTPHGPAFVVSQIGSVLYGLYERDLRPIHKDPGNGKRSTPG